MWTCVMVLALMTLGGDDGRVPLRDCPELEGLEARWQTAMTSIGVPGFGVAVVQGDDVILLDSFGVRNTQTQQPITPDTMFYIASCTKVYVATAIAMLAERHQLELDQPVRKYLPRFTLADAELAQKITVRDLLCHRPGINDGAIVFNDAYTGQITEDRYYRLLERVRSPGHTEYSNLHFTLLGRVIESVSGQSWKDFLARELFTPAGMTRTTAYASKMYADADVAMPTVRSGDGWAASATIKTDRTMHAAGGLGTTLQDAARWLRLHLNGGTIDGKTLLSRASIASMQKQESQVEPSGQIRRLVGFGLGWQVGTYRGRPLLSHGGGYIGASAYLSFLPEDKIGVALLASEGEYAQALGDVIAIDIYDRLLGLPPEDLLPSYQQRARERRAQKRTEPAGANPAQGKNLSLAPSAYAGRFANDDWGAIELSVADGLLVARMGDLKPVLFATGVDRTDVLLYQGRVASGTFVIEAGRVIGLDLLVAGDVAARFARQ